MTVIMSVKYVVVQFIFYTVPLVIIAFMSALVLAILPGVTALGTKGELMEKALNEFERMMMVQLIQQRLEQCPVPRHFLYL
ncbi:hypothetical protein [Vibrio sp. F74]|uniref:hypothetical protein n=1 Tax=Vibrio sp. F74 TaxID=700020 RepID=UPI0035F5D5FB